MGVDLPCWCMQSVLEQEARVAGFKSEVVKSQELHLASLMRDTERLTTNLGNLRNEIRYEVEKLTASQRLDLNLEKGRMRDELQVIDVAHIVMAVVCSKHRGCFAYSAAPAMGICWHLCTQEVKSLCILVHSADQEHVSPQRSPLFLHAYMP